MVVRRFVWLILGIVLAALLWSSVAIAPGTRLGAMAQAQPSIEELQQQQQNLLQQQQQIEQEQQQLQQLENSAQNRLGDLNQSIQATTEQIQQNEARLAQANKQLKALEEELAIAQKSYQDKQVATAGRLRYLQRQRQENGWATLLQSQTLQEFLDRRYKLARVYQADQTILAELRKGAEELETRRQDVERQKNEISLIAQQLQAQKSQFEAQAQTQQATVNRLREDRSALEQAEERLDQDSRDLTAMIQQLLAVQSQGQIVIRGTGRFSLPNDGFISSNFGWRTHPILGYERFHAGVDFGADYGSTIRAADAGVVIFAGWYGGYGQTVIVDHGGGLTSLYAHTSEMFVVEGQPVQKGEAIAAVGSTGLSTGPHLHFEVRANGDPVDPMAYL